MRTSIDGFLPVAAQLKSIPDGETAQKPGLCNLGVTFLEYCVSSGCAEQTNVELRESLGFAFGHSEELCKLSLAAPRIGSFLFRELSVWIRLRRLVRYRVDDVKANLRVRHPPRRALSAWGRRRDVPQKLPACFCLKAIRTPVSIFARAPVVNHLLDGGWRVRDPNQAA